MSTAATLPNQLLEKFQFHLSQLDKELSKYPQLRQLEQTTKVPKTYMMLGAGSVVFTLIFFNVCASFLTTAIGYGYPALASLKALQSKDTKDDCQWLTYWVVFSFFTVIEFFSDFILFWIPLYYVLKTLAIFYLALPQFRGAELVYNKFLLPIVLQAGVVAPPAAESGIKEAKRKAEAAYSEATKSD